MLSTAVKLPVSGGELELYADREGDLLVLDESEAEAHGEAPVQLIEGASYEYKLPDKYEFEPLNGIVRTSKRDSSTGRITPGIFVGTLALNVLESTTEERKTSIALEVRSVKSSYRDDYRFMLEEITNRCTDLIMQHSSPVTQTFSTDYEADASTMYQRFAFVKSILDSEDFREAVLRLITSPVTAWAETEADVDIRKVRRLKNSHLRQIASRSNRIALPAAHPLRAAMESVPARITVNGKIETVDTPENRFVKHALETFQNFCVEVRACLVKAQRSRSRAYIAADMLSEKLAGILNHDFFKAVSPLSSLPLNSPVLQRKEGYREVLRGWLMFDLAAKLVWHGGEDVYSAGKRDVAVLYEYWLFFKLLALLGELFSIDPVSTADLIEPTANGLGLKLKSGKHTPLKGMYEHHTRRMHVEFSYNRTFSGNRPYPEKGSWSRQMRPDYTLSLWPDGFTQQEAENQELIVHIHFDAKYRVENIAGVFGADDSEETDTEEALNKEKEAERRGTYKRADLLKMHAYKDAIRRTAGAYVLYPGNDVSTRMKGFHEIIPGLGAFAIRPSRGDDGSGQLKHFINDVIAHLLDRASQRDRMSYQSFRVHGDEPDNSVREQMPEIDVESNDRSRPPADVSVLIGYLKNDAHRMWVEDNGLYNFRIDTNRGSVRLSPEAAGATYILLHGKGELETGNIRRIKGSGPRIFSQSEMANRGYPSPGSDHYLVYEIEECSGVDFGDAVWDIREVPGYSPRRSSALPFAVSLVQLMKSITS